MRAKFSAPTSCDAAIRRFEQRWKKDERRVADQDLRRVPPWVRRFFHRETLRSALALRDELVETQDHFYWRACSEFFIISVLDSCSIRVVI
jgi:hypothetical protein